MKKELSLKTTEALFTTNRIKAKDAVDGQRVLYIHDGALEIGEVVRCDECPNISVINSGRIDAALTSEEQLLQYKLVHSKMMLEPDSIGCYDADGSGDVLCPACMKFRETATG